MTALRHTIPLVAFIALVMNSMAAQPDTSHFFSAAWWNVENLFDTRDDPTTADDDFTPTGQYHWTARKLRLKLQGIAKTIRMMGMPDVVGLAEVENAWILSQLCRVPALRDGNYRYVHFDSPDRRGIDCALIYRRDRFRIIDTRTVRLTDGTPDFATRDILLVRGRTSAGDTICLLLNHWPSKRGGAEAETMRIAVARTLRGLIDSTFNAFPGAAVVAFGDMNSTLDEPPLADGMGFGTDSVNAEGTLCLTPRLPKNWGTYKYQGSWRYLDHCFLRAGKRWRITEYKLIRFPHLLEADGNRPGQRPYRTNSGPNYQGGLSDHLPLLLTLRHIKASR